MAIDDATAGDGRETLFRGLLEAAPDAIIAVLRDGAVTFMNGQAERLFGYRPDELLGEDVRILLPVEDRESPLHCPAGYFEDPATRTVRESLHVTARRKDGSTFPADVTLSPVETRQGMLIAAAVRDATERLELEARRRHEAPELQRQQSQRLESLGLLAGGVAHDFNNLLSVILTYASFVRRRLQDDPDALADLDAIRLAAERAAGLTRQLLTFGGRDMVRPEVFDLAAAVAEVEKLVGSTLGSHVAVVVDAALDVAYVKADRGRIDQVLVNLAVNARDAMPTGGTLRIDVTAVSVGPDEIHDLGAGRYALLRVTDDGSGMDAEILERAFEPFFTTKPIGEGTGLGLAIVHGIVHQAGGAVHIESERGVGTAVSVYLPMTEEAAPAPMTARPRTDSGSEVILLVEDSYAVRAMTRRILTDHGYVVLVAGGAQEALAIVESEVTRVDLLVSDFMMPQASGPALVARARKVRPGLRALLMTGYAEPMSTSETWLGDDVLVLEKPFTEDALLAKVRASLDRASGA